MTSRIFEMQGAFPDLEPAPVEENKVHFHSSPLAKFRNGKSGTMTGYLNTPPKASLGPKSNIHAERSTHSNHGR